MDWLGGSEGGAVPRIGRQEAGIESLRRSLSDRLRMTDWCGVAGRRDVVELAERLPSCVWASRRRSLQMQGSRGGGVRLGLVG